MVLQNLARMWKNLMRTRPSRPRSSSFRLSVEPMEDRCVPASLSVGDVMMREGNSGMQVAAVEVTLSESTFRKVSVAYRTVASEAAAGSDYQAVSGTLTFNPGQTSKTILVPVFGDRQVEPLEQFWVQLRNAKGATITNAWGTVTIVDDEPRIQIASGTTVEGNDGPTTVDFSVNLVDVLGYPLAYDQAVSVRYSTADGTATVLDGDYVPVSGILEFSPGEQSKTLSVTVQGDTTPEEREFFYLLLDSPSVNAALLYDLATGDIQDDDGWVPPPDDGTGGGWDSWYGDGWGGYSSYGY